MQAAEARADEAVAPLDDAAVLALCRARAQATRRLLSDIAETQRGGGGGPLSDRDRSLIAIMLDGLVADAVAALRRTLLAQAEARDAALAEAVAAGLSGLDEASVGASLAEHGILAETALIEAVQLRLMQHKLEQALERRGTWTWSDAGEAPPGLVAGLLSAGDRRLTEAVNAYVVDRSRRLDPYENPRLPLSGLEPATAASLCWAAAAAIRRLALDQPGLDPAEAESLLVAAVEAIAEREGLREGRRTAATTLAELLMRHQPVTAETLFGLLADGDVPLFESVLARVAGLRPLLASRLLYEETGEGLAIVAKAIDLDRDEFLSLRRLVLAAHDRPGANDAAALAVYDRVPAVVATRVVRRWRRPAPFLDAERRLDAPAGDPPA